MGKPVHLKRILIIRLSAMGDVLLTTPLLRMVKNHFPGIQIDFVVKERYAPLLRNNPHLNRLLTFATDKGFSEVRRLIHQVRKTKYDCIFDLQMNLRSLFFRLFSRGEMKIRYRLGRWNRFLLVHWRIHLNKYFKPVPLRYMELFSPWGVEDDDKGLELTIEEDAKQSLTAHLRSRDIGDSEDYVVLAPGAGHWTKRWPAEGFAQVGRYFCKKGKQVVLVGGIEDKGVCRIVEKNMDIAPGNFAGELSLQETAALLDNAALLISNDTGVMHMGTALGKRVVAIFGPTTRHLGFMPFRTSSIVIERPLFCRPCSFHGSESCPQDHFQCMRQIHSSDVIRSAETLLEKG